ncbi:hypothetical protein E1200_22475 [Actinomadura sp. GC306]|nr:hypothetical protein E1200_22475 [Actinomadura sp. GC306]
MAIASVTSVTSAGCAAIGIASTTITASASPSNPWTLDAVSYSSGVTTGTLNNVEATATINASPPCTVTVGGPGGGPGTINGTFTNSTDVLSVSGSNLEVQTTAGGGCAGLANVGDPITLAGAYQLTSDQHITSP